jgi:5-methylcytosine-specific restriction endonuclease McrA
VCGSDADVEIDHIIPLDRGGLSEWDNLQTLCRAHHALKTRRVDKAVVYAKAIACAPEQREK